MLRALILMALICVYCGMLPSVSTETLSVNKSPAIQISDTDTTSATSTDVTPSVKTNLDDEEIDSNDSQEERYYHPAEDRKPRVLEEYNRQYLDGSYEYKYTLSNGVTRYEKSYWKYVGEKHKKLLARKGFYSHPLPNHKYITVFYTADENGYLQDNAKYTNAVPKLPKHLNIAQLEIPQETSIIKTTTTTTRKPTTTRKITTRKPNTTQRPAIEPSKFNWIY